MRYMVMLRSDPVLNVREDPAFLDAMRAYTDDLGRAGVMLAAEALRSSRTTTRIRFDRGGVRSVDDAAPGGVGRVDGFFLIQVRSTDEAIEWAKRCPLGLALDDGEHADLEVHQLADEPPW